MERQLTTDQKREYLRLLLNDGEEAAREYLERAKTPVVMIFTSDAEAAAYFRAGGRSIVIIAPVEDGGDLTGETPHDGPEAAKG